MLNGRSFKTRRAVADTAGRLACLQETRRGGIRLSGSAKFCEISGPGHQNPVLGNLKAPLLCFVHVSTLLKVGEQI